MPEFTFIETEPKYHRGIQLDEYNGSISIVSCRESDDGKMWKDWAFPQGKDRNPIDKAIPVKVKIGDSYQEAINTLKRMMADLGADSKDTGIYPQQQGSRPKEPPFPAGNFDDDIPF